MRSRRFSWSQLQRLACSRLRALRAQTGELSQAVDELLMVSYLGMRSSLEVRNEPAGPYGAVAGVRHRRRRLEDREGPGRLLLARGSAPVRDCRRQAWREAREPHLPDSEGSVTKAGLMPCLLYTSDAADE